MHNATAHLHDASLKHSVKHRVECDIATLNRKIDHLEREPGANSQLLAAYRMMLKTRTDVLHCLLDSMSTAEHPQRWRDNYSSDDSSSIQ